MIHAIIGVVTALIAATLCPGQSGQKERPPNVVLLVADDQGWADLGCVGVADDVSTPNIDRLANRGTRFTNAYAASPICNASRAALINGRYPQRNGTWWYGGPPLPDGVPTLAEILAKAGYATAYVGKFHYGGNDGPATRSFPLNHGFASLLGCDGGRKHYLIHDDDAENAFSALRKEHQRKGQSLRMQGLWAGRERKHYDGFSTELFAEEAVRFLTTRKADGKPFFLQLAFNAVHNFTHQLPADYLREHELEGLPFDWDPAREPYYEWYQRGRKPNNPEGRAEYLGQLHYLDRGVGLVLDALDELELTDDTLIVYLGDNGGSTPIYADNDPLRGSKYTLYEGGIRVPFLMAWPGHVAAGAVRDDMISALDVLPTVCAATGAPLPEVVDGEDLLPLLHGRVEQLDRDTLVWDTRHEWAVRHGHWKLHIVESTGHAEYEMVELEKGTFLRDLAADPGELTNLAEGQTERVAELRAIHDAWLDRVGR